MFMMKDWMKSTTLPSSYLSSPQFPSTSARVAGHHMGCQCKMGLWEGGIVSIGCLRKMKGISKKRTTFLSWHKPFKSAMTKTQDSHDVGQFMFHFCHDWVQVWLIQFYILLFLKWHLTIFVTIPKASPNKIWPKGDCKSSWEPGCLKFS